MTLLLLAAVLVGPPAPIPQDQTVPAIEQLRQELEQVRKTADGLFLDSTIVALPAAFDLWATDKCEDEGRCVEVNPAGKLPTQRVTLKAAMFPVKIGGLYILRRTKHHNWARGAAIGLGVLDTILGIRAMQAGK